MDEVFRALADPNRRRLLDSLNLRDGQTLGELGAVLATTRQAVSKHLAVLEAAGLVTTVRRGREKLHYLDAEPIRALSDRWIRQYERPREEAAPPPTPAPPAEPASAPDSFVYTLYLRTTPERLWQAITGPAYSRRHMGHALVSTWQKGAGYTWVDGDLEIDDTDQVVLDADPYRRLALTFPAFVPSMAEADQETLDRAAREPRSRVSFDIRPAGEQVELTLVHEGFVPESAVRQMILQGWPRKLSDLKSGLEQV
ncbi:ArsR/SmtB family transcription factor [Mycolicibacterium litorale]|uniref:ArsR family transcriptional regulator n=1 Tax=Mycolicibacterium litorale TaxID=758802 RepID=A0AAD1MUC2_9MYCO|nr:metalloregulator ArsR/SmtB family transcription factor [Mycolicibacterium litorale]MCV7414883.1 metalloregulator ArsR/SmtB family transcription factor [Mycolicibacterium litorale]TDY08130.1 ArsR family transcriptional regulator [Mycolicibacterium litorale]BBY16051.1 ArsR family transcriptional regulator [Mycolicibacterium litorale]